MNNSLRLVFVITLSVLHSAVAALLMHEDFDYAADADLAGMAGGIGFDGTWDGGSWKVGEGSLFYPEGVDLSPAGNSGLENDGVADAPTQRLLSTTISLNSNGVYFISVLIRKADGGTSGDVLTLFLNDGANEKVRFGVSSDEKTHLGLGGGYVAGTTAMPPDMDILVVLKLVTSETGSDSLNLVRYLSGDAVPCVEPPAWDQSTSASISGVLDRIRLASGKGTGQIDEIRIGTSWADVAPIALDPGLLAYEGFVYAADGALAGKAGGAGFAGQWVGGSWKVGVESLAYPAGVALSPTGRSGLENDGVADSPTRRTLSSPMDLGSEGTYYFSALMNKTDGHPTSGDALTLFLNDGTSAKVRFGISSDEKTHLGMAGGYVAGTVAMPAATDILVVAKLVTHAAGTPDSLSLARYLPEETPPWRDPASWDQATSAEISGTLNSISLSCGVGSGRIDEIRIGTSWFSVVGVPPPPPGTVLTLR